MALALDTSLDNGRSLTISSVTFSYTVTGSNPLLLVYARNPNGASPTGVTFNGVSMTLVDSADNATMAARLHMYQLAAQSGTHNVVISYSGSQSFVDSMAASYTGADQTTPIDVHQNDNAGSSTTTYNQSITTTVNNDWTVLFVNNSTGTASAGTGTTSRQSNANGNAMMDSNAAITPAGSNTLQATRPSAALWISVMAAISPAAAAATTKTLAALGVG